jgi:hypothetical protein
MKHLGCASIVLVFGLVACSDNLAPSTHLIIQIDRASLDSRGTLDVAFTIRNAGGRSEEISACGGEASVVFQRQAGTRWDQIGGGLCMANLAMAPVTVPARGSIRGTAGLCCVEHGVFRLVAAYGRDGSAGVVSDPFTP